MKAKTGAGLDGAGLNWRGPAPRFHESVWSVRNKLTHLNALSAKEERRLFSAACGRMSDFKRGSNRCGDVERLARLLPSPEISWPVWFTRPPTFWKSFWEIETACLRYCVRCLDFGFHSVLFQSEELVRCPEHDEALRESCPSCQSTIGYWNRTSSNGAFACACGEVLWRGRDDLASWYPPASFGREIDAFAHRLKRAATPDGAAWRIRSHGDPVETSSRLGFQPGELLAMPRRWRRLFNRRWVPVEDSVQRIVLGEAVYFPATLSLSESSARLMACTWQYLHRHLSAHPSCLSGPSVRSENPPALHARTCVIANARRLWLWQWSKPDEQRRLHELLLSYVVQTVEDVHERCILPTRMVFGLSQWWRLWALIGQRVLVENFLQWTLMAGHSLSRCDAIQSKKVPLLQNRLNGVAFEPRMPPMWVKQPLKVRKWLNVYHSGHHDLSVWNMVSCAQRTMEIRGSLDERASRPLRTFILQLRQ